MSEEKEKSSAVATKNTDSIHSTTKRPAYTKLPGNPAPRQYIRQGIPVDKLGYPKNPISNDSRSRKSIPCTHWQSPQNKKQLPAGSRLHIYLAPRPV